VICGPGVYLLKADTWPSFFLPFYSPYVLEVEAFSEAHIQIPA
jgi:hypothetical protein